MSNSDLSTERQTTQLDSKFKMAAFGLASLLLIGAILAPEAYVVYHHIGPFAFYSGIALVAGLAVFVKLARK